MTEVFSPVLYYSPEMVADLAYGMEDPYEIAARYNLDSLALDQLMEQTWFSSLVAQKRQEIHEEGFLFPAKAAMMAETLWVKLFQMGLNGQLQQPLLVDTAKQLSDIGRLKPDRNATAGAGGPAFQINIQVNGEQKVATVQGGMVEVPRDVLEIEFGSPLPPKPAGLTVPDFDLRASPLVGTPMAVNAATSGMAQPRGSR